ncbi:TetR/AcrR family transcriptional regulator [Mycobacterium heckeshornense]|uniref:TetR/AcrR family transcriptional regulator n=1 Tax=Mycobacterium heckeshornense TaxID=110505 RepID=UPI0019428991|nr:TetR/AcrR family transcriptional regulator [Mycobacterium heckeshornense]
MAACADGTLRHVSSRGLAASLPRYHAVPTQQRTELTRRAITAAAVHAFRVRGYAATTMSTVAAIAKVSPRTLYRYFGSKSELFAATIAETTAEFLEQLSVKIHFAPLREAILVAFEHAEIELHEESREMMRVASTDEKVWQYFLGATSRMQPTLAATLHAAATIRGPSALPADEPLRWDVRAGALLGAISTAYRSWAATPGSELSELVATAIDVVLPILTPPSQHPSPGGGPSPE